MVGYVIFGLTLVVISVMIIIMVLRPTQAVRAANYPDLPSFIDKYFVAGFTPANMQSHIPDQCRFQNDGTAFKVKFEGDRCGQVNIFEDSSAQTVMSFHIYYYTLFDESKIEANGDIVLVRSSVILSTTSMTVH
ncbi:Oidioi.mRNA.OKI2018_I69.PAR.g10320.t1.cds [Oikopleura dioica]|uniref:Oidioi.mRNA.OKI2018_I69.PAR.g10320.t1.cds n=1 Tax=Oikopleura dioica TaxID=34765 RepID=A0ABN7RQ47_OIKDI|nr:Oidioi.mRNA.OKI2018_I69.PAR.g10320.t1.cds [Oikopleura dioica]